MPSVTFQPPGHHKPHCDTDSNESLREIPVTDTQHGARHSGRHNHGYGPEIGNPPRHKRKPKSAKQGVVNEGANLEEGGVVVTPHGARIGNKVIHTVEIYSDRTPRPPRHKDVPPLDLSVLRNSSDMDSASRSAMQVNYQQASKIWWNFFVILFYLKPCSAFYFTMWDSYGGKCMK